MMKETRVNVITTTSYYRDITIYIFEGITTDDKIEQLQAQGIYNVTGIIETI